jgi:hypothetical protein
MAVKRDTMDTWWKSLLSALVLTAITVYLYVTITHAEDSGGSFMLPVILSPIYDLLGKWPIVGLAALLALWAFVTCIVQLVRRPQKATTE